MNQSTELLIRELAEKLGTTSEYLWGVLLKQAPISAVCESISAILLILLTYYVFKFVVKKTTTPPRSEGNSHPCAEWERERAFFAWAAVALLVGIAPIYTAVTMHSVITALLNPAYWALQQLLH